MNILSKTLLVASIVLLLQGCLVDQYGNVVAPPVNVYYQPGYSQPYYGNSYRSYSYPSYRPYRYYSPPPVYYERRYYPLYQRQWNFGGHHDHYRNYGGGWGGGNGYYGYGYR